MKRTIKGILFWLLIIIFAAVFLYSAYKVVDYYIDSIENKKEYSDLYEEVVEDPKPEENKKIKKSKINFDKLAKINSDVVGWIRVPKTQISYPVVKTGNNDYYLDHNFRKEYSVHGAPFVECKIDLKQKLHQNIIIYGHHMKDGSMFAGLDKYINKSQYEKNKFVYFESKKGIRKFQIISVYKMSTSDNNYGLLSYSFNSEKEFNNYVNKLTRKSMYSVKMPRKYTSNLISLCTCEYTLQDGRLIVAAIEVT